MSSIKPIFLLADSQLLFWRDGDEPFLRRARGLIDADGPPAGGGGPRAAYLGASNGDQPQFYDLFVGAMEQIGIGAGDCRHVPADPAPADREHLAGADLVLLAGGDTRRGWEAFRAAGLDKLLVERYYGGALLLGISAGAVQLGLKGWDEAAGDAAAATEATAPADAGPGRLFDTLSLVPFVVDVHDDGNWVRLMKAVSRAGEHGRGLGIPTGGGALYHPDYSVEPVRHPLVEVSLGESGPVQALLLPGAAAPGAAPREDLDRPAREERSALGYSIGADGIIELEGRESPPAAAAPTVTSTPASHAAPGAGSAGSKGSGGGADDEPVN